MISAETKTFRVLFVIGCIFTAAVIAVAVSGAVEVALVKISHYLR